MSANGPFDLINTLTFHGFNLSLKSLYLHDLFLLVHPVNLSLLLNQILSLDDLILNLFVLNGPSFRRIFYSVQSLFVSRERLVYRSDHYCLGGATERVFQEPGQLRVSVWDVLL